MIVRSDAVSMCPKAQDILNLVVYRVLGALLKTPVTATRWSASNECFNPSRIARNHKPSVLAKSTIIIHVYSIRTRPNYYKMLLLFYFQKYFVIIRKLGYDHTYLI